MNIQGSRRKACAKTGIDAHEKVRKEIPDEFYKRNTPPKVFMLE
jgi:hypothetical protein